MACPEERGWLGCNQLPILSTLESCCFTSILGYGPSNLNCDRHFLAGSPAQPLFSQLWFRSQSVRVRFYLRFENATLQRRVCFSHVENLNRGIPGLRSGISETSWSTGHHRNANVAGTSGPSLKVKGS